MQVLHRLIETTELIRQVVLWLDLPERFDCQTRRLVVLKVDGSGFVREK